MRRCRVLHIGKFYKPSRGGIETHLHFLAAELQKHVDLGVVVSSNDRFSHEEVIEGVRVKRVSRWFDVSTAPVSPMIIGEIRRSDADIVHIHLPNPAAVLAYLASGHKGVLICSYHSDIVRQKLLGKAFEPILIHTLRRSSAVIAASQSYIDTSRLLLRFRDRCHVIPYGIPLERFDIPRTAAVEEIRRLHGSPLIVAVGRLVYYKGFEFLIRAMKNVRGKLLLLGDGPLREELETEVRRSGVYERIVSLRNVEDTLPYYQSADLVVLPSIERSEAFGIVQLEAMACGKPVINTNLESGVPSVSLHGATGLTVPTRSSEALAEAINCLLNNDSLRVNYGAAGRRRVEQHFSLEAMVGKTLSLYDDLCGGVTRIGAGHEEAANSGHAHRV